jgi:Uma2 family endonuclease
LNLEIRSLGSRTCDREDLARGLEPDQCYYIQHEAQVRGITQIDLTHFPPPDLAVEVDITSSSLNRFSIYGDLKVPEVWRYDGRSLTIYNLQAGAYQECDRSLALPLLRAEDVIRCLKLHPSTGENSLIKQFRQWLSSQ